MQNNNQDSVNFFTMATKAVDNALGVRLEHLVLVGLAAIALGLVIPAKPVFLDVLCSFSIAISAVIVFICLAAKKTKDLKGFAGAAAAAIFLRLLVGIVAAKLPLLQSNGGLILDFVSNILNPAANFYNLSIFLALIAIASFIIFMMSSKALIKVSAFNYQILPLKKAAINNRLKLGLASYQHTEQLNEVLSQQAKFFISTAGILKLLKTETVISILVIVFSIFISSVSAVSENTEIRMYLGGVGGALLIWISQLAVISLVMPKLSENIFAEASVIDFRQERARDNIKTVVNETDYSEDVKILNPDFADVKAENDDSQIEDLTEDEVNEEMQTQLKFKVIDEKEYEVIAQKILNLKNSKIVALTAKSLEYIPVNIAVNTVIKLGFANKKCLLIDIDSSRKAVQKVFKSSPQDDDLPLNIPQKTCIENVDIMQSDQTLVIDENDKYDKILIYASDYEKLINNDFAAQIIAFTDNDYDGYESNVKVYKIGQGFLND